MTAPSEPATEYSAEEVAARGDEIYEERIRTQVEANLGFRVVCRIGPEHSS